MKYVIGVIGVLLTLAVVFFLIFSKSPDSKQTASPTVQSRTLVDYAAGSSSVSLSTIGKLVGTENHRTIRITVSATERRIEVLSDFETVVLTSQIFPNTQAGYDNFLAGLSGQGFLSSKKTSIADPRSHCPTGQRYMYKLVEMEETISDLWSSSCDKSGTFAGRPSTVRDLFTRQIPEYSDLVNGVRL